MKLIRPTRRFQSGFGRLGCLGLIFTVALLWGGGQGIYTGLKNRQPLEISCADYLKTKPSAEWVTLTDSQLDLMNSAYSASRLSEDKIKEIFIPLRGGNEPSNAPIQLLLASKDQATIDLLTQTNKNLETLKSPEGITPELVQSLRPRRSVSGLIRFGIDSDSKTRDKLAKLDLPLAQDFIILDEGEKPNLGASVGMMLAGLVCAFFLLRGSKDPAQASPPQRPPASSPPPLPPQ